MLGQYHKVYGGRWIQGNCYFGGELYDMNIFSTQLSAEQVKEMYSQGRCANYSQTFGQETFLRWKDVLLQERHGNVTDVEMSECDHTHPTEEDTTDGVEKKWQFLRGTNFYNKVVSEELISDIRARLELLGEFRNHSIDDPLVAHLEKHHPNPVNDTSDLEEEASREETDGAREEGSWGFLTETGLYNKTITEQLLSDVVARLQLLSEFVEHRVDDALILHLEKHHA